MEKLYEELIMCIIITAFEFENSSCEQNSVHSLLLLLAAFAVEEKDSS